MIRKKINVKQFNETRKQITSQVKKCKTQLKQFNDKLDSQKLELKLVVTKMNNLHFKITSYLVNFNLECKKYFDTDFVAEKYRPKYDLEENVEDSLTFPIKLNKFHNEDISIFNSYCKPLTSVQCFEFFDLLIDAMKEYHLFLLDKSRNVKTLIKSALTLSKLDVTFRSRRYQNEVYEEYDKRHITDLQNICDTLNDNIKIFDGKKYYFNPIFGKISSLIGGADADLIIDDNLIDIKTTKYLESKFDYFNQLLGYYVLSIYMNNKNDKSFNIKKVFVYYSRYGILLEYKLPDKNDKAFIEFYNYFIDKVFKNFNK